MSEVKFPELRDLDEDQIEIWNLDKNKDFIIAGPPGTGKTVMALYRAHILQKDNDDDSDKPILIVKQHLLRQYCEYFAKNLKINSDVKTFGQYLYQIWKWPLRRRGAPPGGIRATNFNYKWDEIINQYKKVSSSNSISINNHIIIDEGQDIGAKFYFLVGQLSNKTKTIFLDENQTIFDNEDQSSKLIEVQQLGDIDTKVRYLNKNYRNTRQIALVSKHFYVGREENAPVIPKDKHGPLPELLNLSKKDFIKRVVLSALNQKFETVAILVPERQMIGSYQKEITAEIQKYLGDRTLKNNKVQTWYGGNNKSIDFSSDGIFIIQYHNAKGLEFDTVYLAEMDKFQFNTNDIGQNLFYSLCARARKRLYGHYSEDGKTQLVMSYKEAIGKALREEESDNELIITAIKGNEKYEFTEEEWEKYKASEIGEKDLKEFEKTGGIIELTFRQKKLIKKIEESHSNKKDTPSFDEKIADDKTLIKKIEEKEDKVKSEFKDPIRLVSDIDMLIDELSENDKLNIWDEFEEHTGTFIGWETKRNKIISFSLKVISSTIDEYQEGDEIIFNAESIDSLEIYRL